MVLVPLFIRFKLGAVLGYLLAGVVIGPHVLGFIGDPEKVMHFAEFGVVDLSAANLSGATLSGADLSRAKLFGANLNHIRLKA